MSSAVDDDSDTYSVDSLDVDTVVAKKTDNFLCERNPIRVRDCTNEWVCAQSKTVQDGYHTSNIQKETIVEAFSTKEEEGALVKRSESNVINDHSCKSDCACAKSNTVQERCPTSKIIETEFVDAFSIEKDENTSVERSVWYKIKGCTSERVRTQSNTVQGKRRHASKTPKREAIGALSVKENQDTLVNRSERYEVKDHTRTSERICKISKSVEDTSIIPDIQTIEAFTGNETEENRMKEIVKYIDGRECTEGWLLNTADLQGRYHSSNIPEGKTVETFSLQETEVIQIQTVAKYPMEDLTSDWVSARPKTVPDKCHTATSIPDRKTVKSFSVKPVEDSPSKTSRQLNPVTDVECTSKRVGTVSNETRLDLQQIYHSTVENSNEILLPDKRGKKQKKKNKLEVPFYNRTVTLSEARKIQKINIPNAPPKKPSIHVLADEKYERSRPNPNHPRALSNGVVERWRHKVKPIYEHSTLVDLSVGKDKCNRSSMTTISDAVSKMKIEESNSRPRRTSKSCCDGRSRSLSLQKPQPPNSKHVPFGSLRTKASTYLEQYRVEKYGPIFVKKKPPSDGTECSVFDGTTVASLSSELRDKPATFSSPDSSGDEMSFYRKIISGEIVPAQDGVNLNRLSDEYDNLKSVSQVDVNANRDHGCPRQRVSYVPYSLEDYRTMLHPTRLGRLGPDLEANKEKLEKLRKQREYGDLASLKNIQKMQYQKKKLQAQLQFEPQTVDSTQQSTNQFSEDYYCLTSTSQPQGPCSTVTAATANTLSTLWSERESNRKKTVTKTVTKTKTKKKQTMAKAKHKEQQSTFTSNKTLIKMLQERHKRELEQTEKLRKENLV